MAEKKKFSLAEQIGATVGSTSIAAMDAAATVSASDAKGREQIVYLPRTSLVADEKNFYSMDGIEELAKNIECVGLLDPLRVRPIEGEDGLYRVVSGHRRRAALDWLALHGSDPGEVACIVEKNDGVSPALAELRLIFANSDTRRMSGADISKQAERVEALLYQLKEEGYEFPGRMRDHVAEACKVSATKLANLKVIRENLIPEWKKRWEDGTLNDVCALTLAQMPHERQRIFEKRYSGDPCSFRLMEWSLKDYGTTLDAIAELQCGKKYGGGECENRVNMCEAALHRDTWKQDCRRCCSGCQDLTHCKYACPRLAGEIAKRKANAKAAKEAAKNATRDEDAAKIDKLTRLWKRSAELREKSGMSVDAYYKAAHGTNWLPSVESITALDAGTKKITAKADSPFGYLMTLEEIDALNDFADKLGVTLDYLLCRSDEPHGGAFKSDADAAPQWQTGTPEHEGWYAVIDRMGDYETLYWRKRDANWFSHESAIRPYLCEDEHIEQWIQLPRKWERRMSEVVVE